MVRKSLILLSGLLCTSLTYGKINDKRVNWGLKATVDAELPTKWHGEHNDIKMFNNGVGFTIGAISNISIAKNFYFEPGISFFLSQYRYDLIVADGKDKTENPMLSKYGIEIPTLFGYTIDFNDMIGLHIFTGPQIRYAFTGKVGLNSEEQKEENENLLLWDSNRRFDFSWKIGIGLPIQHFMISVEADFGITNLYKKGALTGHTNWNYRENRVGAGITYYF